MRRRLAALPAVVCASVVALPLSAQEPPPRLEPLPEPPPAAEAAPDEPAVRIPVQEGDKIELIREGRRVVAVRVTPPGGRAYWLVDPTGEGNWLRRDALDWSLAVPMYLLFAFD